MNSYWNIGQATSDCVHFVYSDEIDLSDRSISEDLRKKNILVLYLDYQEISRSGEHIANIIAEHLELEHAPYVVRSQPKIWVPFSDDLIGKSESESGMVIIIDGANLFLNERPRDFFGLIEAFLDQFDRWLKEQKPCHLCFQMEENSWVRNTFSQ